MVAFIQNRKCKVGQTVVIAFLAIFLVNVALTVGLKETASGRATPQTNQPAVKRAAYPEKIVALTFDDGPDPNYTPRLLRILREAQVAATFFMIGEEVERYPRLARRVAREGHAIGNHTYSHILMRDASTLEIRFEIAECQRAIEYVTGEKPIHFRPPRGQFDYRSILAARDYGLKIALWDICVEQKEVPTATGMAQRVSQNIEARSVILAHDGRLNRDATIEAMPAIIRDLKARGYRFVTLDEFSRRPRIQAKIEHFDLKPREKETRASFNKSALPL